MMMNKCYCTQVPSIDQTEELFFFPNYEYVQKMHGFSGGFAWKGITDKQQLGLGDHEWLATDLSCFDSCDVLQVDKFVITATKVPGINLYILCW